MAAIIKVRAPATSGFIRRFRRFPQIKKIRAAASESEKICEICGSRPLKNGDCLRAARTSSRDIRVPRGAVPVSEQVPKMRLRCAFKTIEIPRETRLRCLRCLRCAPLRADAVRYEPEQRRR